MTEELLVEGLCTSVAPRGIMLNYSVSNNYRAFEVAQREAAAAILKEAQNGVSSRPSQPWSPDFLSAVS